MSIRKRTKPHTGMLMHFEADSVLTSSVAALQATRLTASACSATDPVGASPGKGSVLDWPRNDPGGYPSAARLPNAGRYSGRSFQEGAAGSRLGDQAPGSALEATRGSRVSVSGSALDKVLEVLAESKDISKADMFAALRAKPVSRIDPCQDITALPGNSRQRPTSGMDKLERYQFQNRPSSASGIRQRQRSMPTLPRGTGAAQAIPAAQCFSRSPESTAQRRTGSVPTPSLLNFSRPFPGFRSSTCW